MPTPWLRLQPLVLLAVLGGSLEASLVRETPASAQEAASQALADDIARHLVNGVGTATLRNARETTAQRAQAAAVIQRMAATREGRRLLIRADLLLNGRLRPAPAVDGGPGSSLGAAPRVFGRPAHRRGYHRRPAQARAHAQEAPAPAAVPPSGILAPPPSIALPEPNEAPEYYSMPSEW